MTVREFKLEQLEHLDDGRIITAWNQAVKRCVQDCEDRPGVGKSRKVTLTLDLVPTLDEDGQMDDVKGSFQIKDSAPIRQTKKYSFGVRRGQTLVFDDLSEDNANQKTIPMGDDDVA